MVTTLSHVSDMCGFIFCVAGLTAEIQELVTKTIRSPPINSGIKHDLALLMYVNNDITGFPCHRSNRPSSMSSVRRLSTSDRLPIILGGVSTLEDSPLFTCKAVCITNDFSTVVLV